MKTLGGKIIPQYEFDLNPKKFFEDHMNPDEFEYLDLVETNKDKKGDKKCLHHKILVKPSILKPLVMDFAKERDLFFPVSGKILSYQK
jgi:hypothetical protein